MRLPLLQRLSPAASAAWTCASPYSRRESLSAKSPTAYRYCLPKHSQLLAVLLAPSLLVKAAHTSTSPPFYLPHPAHPVRSREKAAASCSEARPSARTPRASCQQWGTPGHRANFALHTGLPRTRVEAQRVIAQKLIFGDMNEQRRQAGRLGIERRGPGVPGARAGEISAGRRSSAFYA